MFDRLTMGARIVIVQAAAEARALGHAHVDTEHLLLALVRDRDSGAAAALRELGATPDNIQTAITSRLPPGPGVAESHQPFTANATRVLETAASDAADRGDPYVGTEHLLVAISQSEGVAGDVLRGLASHEDIGRVVHARSGGGRPPETTSESATFVTTLLDGSDDDARSVLTGWITAAISAAGEGRIGSHHLLAAVLNDENSAAARTLREFGVDLAALRERLRHINTTGYSDEPPQERPGAPGAE